MPHLRIIIRQKYRQEHRYGKEASHADYEKCAKVLTSIHPLYPIQEICHEYKSGQDFHGLRYGWYVNSMAYSIHDSISSASA